MGRLDEAAFARAVSGCTRCAGTTFEITAYLDQKLEVMLADPNGKGRWVYDGEAFIDGVYRVRCVGCGHDAFASTDCPRCHAAGGLDAGLAAATRLAVPRRCPRCDELELSLVGFAPATVKVHGPGRPPPPVATATLGDPGFHVVAIACDSCDWATVSERCPICDAAPPLRARA